MKKCCICKKEKELSEFHKKKESSDGHVNICKKCRLTYHSEWYNKNKKKVYELNKEKKEKIQMYIWNHLSSHPCVDLGGPRIIKKENEHVTGKKDFSIAEDPHRRLGLVKLQAEIDKCVIRCANCHRRKTAKQLGWFTPPKL